MLPYGFAGMADYEVLDNVNMSAAETPAEEDSSQALAKRDALQPLEQPSCVAGGDSSQSLERPSAKGASLRAQQQPLLAEEPQTVEKTYQEILAQVIERIRNASKWPPQYGEKSSNQMPLSPQETEAPLETRWKCDQCGKFFSRSGNLQRHLEIHAKRAKPHKCKDCGKCFTRINHLRRHCRIHSGDKPHKCGHCDKSFTRSDNMAAHLQLHMGDNQ